MRNRVALFVVIAAQFSCGGSAVVTSPDRVAGGADPDGGMFDAGPAGDAGTPSDAGVAADAGVADAGSGDGNDAGYAADGGAGDGGASDAACDPIGDFIAASCLDAGTVEVSVWQSGDPACANLLPVDVPEATTLVEVIEDGPSGQFIECGAAVDGDGHLGLCAWNRGSAGGPEDGDATSIYGTDGNYLGRSEGRVVASQPNGFLTETFAQDYGGVTALYGWSPDGGGSLFLSVALPAPYDVSACGYAVAPDGTVVASCYTPDAGFSLQQFDLSLLPAAPREPSNSLTLMGIDTRHRMIASGDDGVRWRDLDGGNPGPAIDAGAESLSPLGSLVGGGFELAGSVLLPEDTAPSHKPAWLAARNNAPFTLVRGGAAYAFVRPPDPANCEVSQIELVASGGTVCATIAVRENQCSARLSVGANGSILDRAPQRFCSSLECAEAFRLWPGVLH